MKSVNYHCNGEETGWISEPYNKKELERLTIDQLIVLLRKGKKKWNKSELIELILK